MPTSITVAPGFTKSGVTMPARADGGHQNVGAAADPRQVARLGVADRDGRVLVQQQHGNRLADDVAAAHHHRFRAGDRDIRCASGFP